MHTAGIWSYSSIVIKDLYPASSVDLRSSVCFAGQHSIWRKTWISVDLFERHPILSGDLCVKSFRMQWPGCYFSRIFLWTGSYIYRHTAFVSICHVTKLESLCNEIVSIFLGDFHSQWMLQFSNMIGRIPGSMYIFSRLGDISHQVFRTYFVN
jgi:hypothetical protein